MIYRLPKWITKESIYNEILPDLTRQYFHLKKGMQTELSFAQTEKIYANALPLLICMINLLQYKTETPVYLEFAYTPRLFAFLDAVGFFYQLKAENLIKYDEDEVGGYSEYDYDNMDKILIYYPEPYDERLPEVKKREIRDRFEEKIKDELKGTRFFKSDKTVIKNDDLRDKTLTTMAELICNAKIYSPSLCFTYMQSNIKFEQNKKGYIVCVADTGRGYYESLTEKIKNQVDIHNIYTQEQREIFYQYAENLGIDVQKEINFLSIMEALYYSQNATRKMNMYKLKNMLAISNANLRIHQRNREIVFTADKCCSCSNRDILRCLKCIWNRRNAVHSSYKVYPIAMAGIHIEIEFIQGEVK